MPRAAAAPFFPAHDHLDRTNEMTGKWHEDHCREASVRDPHSLFRRLDWQASPSRRRGGTFFFFRSEMDPLNTLWLAPVGSAMVRCFGLVAVLARERGLVNKRFDTLGRFPYIYVCVYLYIHKYSIHVYRPRRMAFEAGSGGSGLDSQTPDSDEPGGFRRTPPPDPPGPRTDPGRTRHRTIPEHGV